MEQIKVGDTVKIKDLPWCREREIVGLKGEVMQIGECGHHTKGCKDCGGTYKNVKWFDRTKLRGGVGNADCYGYAGSYVLEKAKPATIKELLSE